MKNLSKEEFEIYCLFIAANADFNITKHELDRQNLFSFYYSKSKIEIYD